MQDVTIHVQLNDDDDLYDIQQATDDYPDAQTRTSTEERAGVHTMVEPVTAMLITAGLAVVVKVVIDWWERFRGGLVIDQRSSEPRIYRDREVPAGYILVFPAEGEKVEIKTVDMPKDAVHQLIESVIAGVLTSAKEIAKAAASETATAEPSLA